MHSSFDFILSYFFYLIFVAVESNFYPFLRPYKPSSIDATAIVPGNIPTGSGGIVLQDLGDIPTRSGGYSYGIWGIVLQDLRIFLRDLWDSPTGSEEYSYTIWERFLHDVVEIPTRSWGDSYRILGRILWMGVCQL